MKTKASSVVTVREMARKHGIEPQILAKLTEEEQRFFRTTVPIAWVSYELEAKIIKAYADALMPGDPGRYDKAGIEMAKNQFNGIYKFFFKILSPQAIAEKTAVIYSTMNEKGTATSVCSQDKKELMLVVKDFPEFPEDSRMLYCGYIKGVMELTGVKNVRVRVLEDPQLVQWLIQWD